ncbi:hypothetical protein CYLTODRAFT_379300 [Cylindrobasidium torrendii FP15055 ss-10]|uniref:Amino acid transporter transmembrane domain-containing protein n=1 Tax=Cylindrobasidium torrendii FP15055 ss-10 TaxID=1314674 RepID=A0A0D7B4M2_9AGAR|nr:hypothetical protein CYLTODRAFT_379300 [Cylindrobasidium torrendii FP15055 ss-10]
MTVEDHEKTDALETTPIPKDAVDVFDESKDNDIHYKTLTWPFVALLMIAEIVSNGTLSLPSALAVVGIVPAVILIVFLGVFALYTSKLLIDFKLNHPGVHSMGDAGYIMGGPILREILGGATVVFAIVATGSELLSGQQALSTLSDNGMCALHLLLIFSAFVLLIALPRTLEKLQYLGLVSAALITISGIVAMGAAGANPVPGRVIKATIPSDFYTAFVAITNPCFSYAGHFMFFILVSEMKHPEDGMKAAWCLQTFATSFYVLFSVIMYCYIGGTTESPVFFSLPPYWSKVCFGIAIGNFVIAGGLFSHTAAKLVFVRLFRGTRHMYKHTVVGWGVWVCLCFLAVVIAFVLASAIPIFSYLIGVAAALFASWFTYGVAGMFFIHDTHHSEDTSFRRKPIQTALAVFSILAGGFICVAGTYVFIKLIVDAYNDGTVGQPFTC